jgi:GntR family transcriptional regulator/MocR family aminotransferase
MLTYDFSDNDDMPLYERLYTNLKRDILSGFIASGEKLPSKREFAKNLGISSITVENAYAQLIAEGYLYALEKKGYFVRDITPIMKESPRVEKTSFVKKDESSSSIMQADSNGCVDFVSGRTSPENFPFSTWAKIMRQILSSEQNALMTNSPCNGIPRLRKAIAAHLSHFYGMSVLPEQIVVGAGTEYLYAQLIQLLGSNLVYGVENPGYRKPAMIYRSLGAKCCSVPLDENGVSIESLNECNVDVVHISPSHQFPTGITMPVSRRYELLAWASKNENRFILEDDYDSEFRLSGKPFPTLQSIDATGKVIYMNTFSKTLSSTVRISYMVLPLSLSERYMKTLGFYSCTVPNFEQYTLSRFIEDGYFEKHINRMRNFYRRQNETLLNTIRSSSCAKYISVKAENAGLHFLLHIDTSLSDEKLVDFMQKNHIRVSCLSSFYDNPPPKDLHTLVINYSSISSGEIKSAAEKFVKAVGQIIKTRNLQEH